LKQLKSILAAIIAIFLVFVITSLFDLVLVFFFPRFYSNAAFITTFGVGGIFAGVIGYMNGKERSIKKNEKARRGFISLLIIMDLLFFFLLAKMEGGEYEPAFKAFGATMALSSLLFVKGKPE
jgi:dolichol kinase